MIIKVCVSTLKNKILSLCIYNKPYLKYYNIITVMYNKSIINVYGNDILF
jgi:hypothetical protein